MTKRPSECVEPLSERRSVAAAELCAGVIELASDGRYQVRQLGGELQEAQLAPGCSAALADECLRLRRTVLLAGGEILGALQTEPSAVERQGGQLKLDAEQVVIEAGEALSLRVGDSELLLRPDGSVRLVGQRLALDGAALIKLLSAKVELP
ncbi:MAG: hypothetical protein DRI90_05740 [Deltaproteobacteria bacterium]|nr:MAG: hypothetical protein DRI90_05740 [Deltaproteobacteria bacterium]